MNTIQNNIDEAISSFNAIKDKIIEKGVNVPEGTRARELANKVEDVYKAGIQTEYDRFWDSYQENGGRKAYQYAFAGHGWNADTFKPKYNIILDNTYAAHTMFYGSRIPNIKASLAECGVVLNTTGAKQFTQAFQSCITSELPTIDLSNATHTSYAFGTNPNLHTIDKIIMSENTVINNNMFNGDTALENVIFEGTIAQNGLDLHWSTKLSKASITSVVNTLSSTTSGLTVTLSKTAVNNAFYDENLFNPLHNDKYLSRGLLVDGIGTVVTDYIDCADFDYIAISKAGSYGWYSDKNENTLISSENKSSFDIFRCYQKPEGARYIRFASPKDTEVVACRQSEAVRDLNGSNSVEWNALVTTRPNWTFVYA